MAEILKVDPTHLQLTLGQASAELSGPMADLICRALLTMLPEEKLDKMAAAPAPRAYLLHQISASEYQALSEVITHLNQSLGQEVLRSQSRERGPDQPLQAKIMLGEKRIVRRVELV